MLRDDTPDRRTRRTHWSYLPLEDDVLLALDERAGGQLREHGPVQAALLDQVNAPQIGCWVAQVGPADESVDLGMVEALVGVVDDQLQALAETHADHVVVVLRFDEPHWLRRRVLLNQAA